MLNAVARARLIRALGGGKSGAIRMSLYTHWACFDCRKSFHKLPPSGSESEARGCPECSKEMCDMGVYFEPPRKQAKKSWELARLLGESGYKFQTEGSVAYIKAFILGSKRPRIDDVRLNIESDRRLKNDGKSRERLRWYKGERGRRRHV
jgi:hypothetical protein